MLAALLSGEAALWPAVALPDEVAAFWSVNPGEGEVLAGGFWAAVLEVAAFWSVLLGAVLEDGALCSVALGALGVCAGGFTGALELSG